MATPRVRETFGPGQAHRDDDEGRVRGQRSPEGGQANPRSRGFVLDLASVGDAARGVENFEGDEIAMLVVVENDARLILVAFRHRDALFQNDAEQIRLPIAAIPGSLTRIIHHRYISGRSPFD